MLKEEVLCLTEDEIKRVIEIVEPGPDARARLDKDIEELQEWLDGQPHLPKNEDYLWLRSVLMFSKFDVQKAKSKLETLYMTRRLFPEFYEERDPSSPEMKKQLKSALIMPLPRLNDDLCRVSIFKLLAPPEDVDALFFSKSVFLTLDIRCGYFKEFCVADHFIVDCENAEIGHLLKVDFNLIRKGVLVIKNSYAERVKGLHVINFPSFAYPLWQMIQPLLTEKLRSRVFFHKDFESIHKIISKRILPKDYGGYEKSFDEFADNWRNYLEDAREWLIRQESRKSDEALRPHWAPIDTEIYGAEGSFRQLQVD